MKEKVALITGGASGLGATISEFLASKQINLIINYNTSSDKALSLKEELENKYNIKVLTIKCDISNEIEVNNMIDIITKEFDHIDYLVNNAALCIDSLYNDKTKDNFMKTLEVNVVGTFLVSKLVGNLMYEQKYGSIVNLSSTNGIDKNFPMSLDYDASKAALNSLTHNLALQYAPYVRVNAVAPGWVKTENEIKDLDEEYIKSEEEKIYVGRFAECEEIAKVIYFLLSDDASYINNQIIKVDGGMY
ncbi:MAG: SDR family oxidoreductase [Bacilli bacterium]|nr:SDR family oxidoreductase [Bacilli bacterium]